MTADPIGATAGMGKGGRQRLYPGWTMVAVAIVFQVLVYGTIISTFTFWAPYWMASFGAGPGEAMIAAATTLFVSAMVAPAIGVLLERLLTNCFTYAMLVSPF